MKKILICLLFLSCWLINSLVWTTDDPLIVFAAASTTNASFIKVDLWPDFDFANAFKDKLAMGDPMNVPAGIYSLWCHKSVMV